MRDVVVQPVMDDLRALPRDRSIHLVVHGMATSIQARSEAWERLWPR